MATTLMTPRNFYEPTSSSTTFKIPSITMHNNNNNINNPNNNKDNVAIAGVNVSGGGVGVAGGSSSVGSNPGANSQLLQSLQTSKLSASTSPSQIIPSVQHIQQSINLQPIKIPSPIEESSKFIISPNDRISNTISNFNKSYHYSTTTNQPPTSASSFMINSSPTLQTNPASCTSPANTTTLPPVNSRSPQTRLLAPMQIPQQQSTPSSSSTSSSQPIQTPPQPIPTYSTNQYVYYQQPQPQPQQAQQFPPGQYVYYQQQQQPPSAAPAQQQQQYIIQQQQQQQQQQTNNPYYQQIRYQQHQQLQQVNQTLHTAYHPHLLPPHIITSQNIRRKSKQSTTWSPKEDKLLRELKEVQKLGWREISTFFHDRTPNACQFRWRRIISSVTGNTSTLNITRNNHTTSSSNSSNGTSGKSVKGSGHSINFLLN